ncbi:hypothetical protein [Chitinophaga sp. OAE865]|uniref:hypothetical protein n=1 Tax=Chitinophaga sp. OAE865 TaxID=2817898 RepID=UPI001AE1F5D9
MAILTEGINFIGRIGNLNAYKLKGSDKIIVRKNTAGPSKADIQSSPTYQRVRENITEFGACSSASKAIRQVLYPVKHLADYNFTPTLCKLAKNIQVMDTAGERGKRSILLSRYGHLLEGFQLNRINTFDSIIRHPVACSINRETGSATIKLPALVLGINFITSRNYARFRFVATIGLVPDIVYKVNNYKSSEQTSLPEVIFTEWQSLQQSFEAQSITMQLKELNALSDTKTIMVGIGIEMGVSLSNQVVERIKHAGAAKILAVG